MILTCGAIVPPVTHSPVACTPVHSMVATEKNGSARCSRYWLRPAPGHHRGSLIHGHDKRGGVKGLEHGGISTKVGKGTKVLAHPVVTQARHT